VLHYAHLTPFSVILQVTNAFVLYCSLYWDNIYIYFSFLGYKFPSKVSEPVESFFVTSDYLLKSNLKVLVETISPLCFFITSPLCFERVMWLFYCPDSQEVRALNTSYLSPLRKSVS